MTTILRIDCSPRGAEAHSWRMADELMQRLTTRYPGAQVIRRNLAETLPPLVDQAFAAAMREHQTAEGAKGVAALATSEAMIAELEASDVLVLSTPMHNFTVPANLKAWIDQVVRFGRTFQSTPDGKVGLLQDRPTFVIVASGGHFMPPKARQPDFLTAYLGSILATIGIHDVTILPLEGLTRGDAEMAEAYRRVREQIDRRLPL